LSYKHFFAGRFLAHNIMAEWGKHGLADIVDSVMTRGLSHEQMIEEVARRATTETLETRAANERLTGEWIIYATNNGKNYYLACGLHEADHLSLYDDIMKHCVRDFPD